MRSELSMVRVLLGRRKSIYEGFVAGTRLGVMLRSVLMLLSYYMCFRIRL